MSPAVVGAEPMYRVPVDELPMAEVWNVVEAVWESLLGVWPAPAQPVDFGTDWLMAGVTVQGNWAGSVTETLTVALSCSPRTAHHISRTMLDLAGDDPDPDADDVEDAVREMANVLGGNVKALMPGGLALGLPVLTVGCPDVEGRPIAEVHVGWPGHRARIAVWRSAAPPQALTTTQQTQTPREPGGNQQ